MNNRLRVKEIIAENNALLERAESSARVTQYDIAKTVIPFNMTDNSKAQLLAKWNNGKALQKLTCEVLANLVGALGCTSGDLIGTPYVRLPEDCRTERRLYNRWNKFREDKGGNTLDALVKISHEYKTAIDFILLTEEEHEKP